MMGIAFIGALCGHEKRITAGADRAAILEKVRQQISKKFGAKGDAVVAGNMAVIAEGAEATHEAPAEEEMGWLIWALAGGGVLLAVLGLHSRAT